MAKETLMIDVIFQMMTGMSLEEAVDISVKEGNDAMTQALMEGAAKKRREGDLMSPENMMGKPKGQKEEDTKEETFVCPLCEEEKRISCRVLKGCCRSCSSCDI